MANLNVSNSAQNLSILLQMFDNLSQSEQRKFLRSIKQTTNLELKDFQIKSYKDSDSYLLSNKFEGNRPTHCPICGGTHIIKFGVLKGRQRFCCKDCKKTFGTTHNTITKSSKKPLQVWQTYISCMIHKMPLRATAAICDISLNTAFVWRHKILDALQNMMSSVKLEGVIEADETYMRLSFKGNHKDKESIFADREPYKRGTRAKKRGLSKEQACVQTAINLDGKSIAKIIALGKPKYSAMNEFLKGKISKNSMFVTDGFSTYSKISKEMELQHVKIAKGRYTNGAFNIQLLNNYHAQFKKLVNVIFQGVSTKYLNNYLVYHNLVNFAKGCLGFKYEVMEKFCLTTDCVSLYKDIAKRKAIPINNLL